MVEIKLRLWDNSLLWTDGWTQLKALLFCKLWMQMGTMSLGIWIDKNLDWNHHTSILTPKLKQQLKLLKLGRNILDVHKKRILYFTQFYSHLKYGISLWGNSITNKQLESIQ